MRPPHWYDDSYDPLECHWCGLNWYESMDSHVPLEPGRAVKAAVYGLPVGLCSRKERHPIHEHPSATLGRFWCTGKPEDREPERSRRRWQP